MSHPCQHVAPERVGAQREGCAGLCELVRDDGVGVAPDPDGHHEGQQGGTADGDDAGGPPRVLHRGRRAQATGTGRLPHEEAAGHSGDDAGGECQCEQEEDLGLKRRHVLSGGRVQELAAQSRDGEDLLHGDRAAGQGDDDQSHLTGQGRQSAAQDGPGQGPASDTRSGPGGHPALGEGGGDGVGDESAEVAAGGQAQAEGRHDDLLGAAPPEGRQDPEVDGQDEHEDRGQEVLGQGDEDRGGGAAARPGAPSQPVAQGGQDQGGGHDDPDAERGGHEAQGDPEGVHGVRADVGSRDPGAAQVAAGHSSQPVADDVEGAAVDPDALADGCQDLRCGLPVGGGGAQDRQGRVLAREPWQHAHQADEAGQSEQA